jgi:hypothetical protein
MVCPRQSLYRLDNASRIWDSSLRSRKKDAEDTALRRLRPAICTTDSIVPKRSADGRPTKQKREKKNFTYLCAHFNYSSPQFSSTALSSLRSPSRLFQFALLCDAHFVTLIISNVATSSPLTRVLSCRRNSIIYKTFHACVCKPLGWVSKPHFTSRRCLITNLRMMLNSITERRLKLI